MPKEKPVEPVKQEAIPLNPHEVNFPGGSVKYNEYGNPDSQLNPILIVPGFVGDAFILKELATKLSEDNHHHVLVMNQPAFDDSVPARSQMSPDKVISLQAEAAMAICQDAGLLNREVNLFAHSMAALVVEKLKQIASERGVDSFDSSKGSKTILAAPAGTIHDEGLLDLGLRWSTRYLPKAMKEAPVLDPTGLKGKEGAKNMFKNLPKTIGEVGALAERRVDYKNLGQTLLIVYPEDKMFPYKRMEPTLVKALEDEAPLQIVMPVNAAEVGPKDFSDFKRTNDYKTKKATRLAYALHHRAAGHDDPNNNPARTARIALDYFDHQ